MRVLRTMKDKLHEKDRDNWKPGTVFSSFLAKLQPLNEKIVFDVFDNCLILERSFDTEFYKTEFSFCKDFLKKVDERFQDLYDISAFEYFDLDYLKRHFQDSDLIEKFNSFAPDLVKKLELQHFADDIFGGYPYLIDFFQNTVTRDDKTVTISQEFLSHKTCDYFSDLASE